MVAAEPRDAKGFANRQPRRAGRFEGARGRDIVKSFKIKEYYNINIVKIENFAENYVISRF